jgi:hypothetical protein
VQIDDDGLYLIIPEDPGVVYPMAERRRFDELNLKMRVKLLILRFFDPGTINRYGEVVSRNEYLID